MTGKRWDGSTWVDLTTFKRWDGTSWVNLTVGKRWDGSTWVDMGLFGGGSNVVATANQTSFVRYRFSLHGSTIGYVQTLTDCIVTGSGGTGPYTYAWTRVAGDSAISANSPTSNTTRFSANVPTGTVYFSTFRCTVTDSLGATGFVDVTVGLEYDNGSI